MRARIAFLLIIEFAFTASGQDHVPAQTAPEVEPSATASIHVNKHSFKSGEDIEVIILLEGGAGGDYIPKGWGLMGGGIPGFSVYLTTLSGKPAETCGLGGDTWPTHEPDARVVLRRDFIYLPAQHIVGLRTDIGCPTKKPGKYLVNAAYSPFQIDADEVARLPETHGRVLRKVVQAVPVTISIH